MDEAQAFALLPEEQVEGEPEAGFFPPPDTSAPPPRVPRNAEEVASQLAMALDEEEGSFPERYGKHLSDLKSGGVNPPLARVLERELDDNIEAGRAQAYAYAAVQDVTGVALAAKHTADLEASRPFNTPEQRPVEAQLAMATRALESQGVGRGATIESHVRKLDEGAAALTTRNILESVAKENDDKATRADSWLAFGRGFTPYNLVEKVRAISVVTGVWRGVDEFAAVTDLRDILRQLEPAQVQHVVKQVLTEVGTNPAVRADTARTLLNLTKGEAAISAAFDATFLADVGAVAQVLGRLARKGVPAAVVRDVSGEKAAADIVATDLLTNGKLSGLNNSEQVARALSAGVSPLEIDPAATVGLAPHMQQKLRDSWDAVLDSVKERLNSSSLSADEVAAGQAQVRESWMRDTNKQIYSVQYGEASADGLKMQVFWQGRDGAPLLSRAAAEAEAKRLGLADYTIVPKNAAEQPDVLLRGNAFDEAEEIAAIQVDAVPTLQKYLKEVEKQIKFFEKDYSSDVAVELSMAKQWKLRLNEAIENAKGVKTGNEALDFWPHYDELVTDFLGTAPEPNAAILKAVGLSDGRTTTTSKNILTALSTSASDPAYRHLAKRLLANKGIDWSQTTMRVVDELPNGFSGGYNIGTDKAAIIRKSLSGNAVEEILLHETLHAHSAQIIKVVTTDAKAAFEVGAATGRQVVAVKELQALQKALTSSLTKLAGKASDDTLLTLKNAILDVSYPDELLTYGLTDPAMRALFGKLKLRDIGLVDEGSVLSKLWTNFKELLGFTGDDTVLAKVYSVFDKLDADANEVRRAWFSRSQVGRREQQAMRGREGDGEWLIQERRDDPLSYSAVGKFTQKDIDGMSTVALDPKHAASEQGLEARVVGVHAEAKTKAALTAFIEPFYKKLSKAQVQKVHAVLTEGDGFSNAGKVGREFSYSEVAARGLNDDEALAYMATRQLRMAMYHLRNGEMVRHLRAQGLKEVEIGGVKAAGRVLDVDAAQAHTGGFVYDASTKTTLPMDGTAMNNAYAAGKHLVHLTTPTQVDGQLRQLMLVDNASATVRDITTALHYRPGEFSRIYTDEYFIRAKRRMVVDGVEKEVETAIRTARSASEAEAFTVALRQAIDVLKNGKGNVDNQLQELLSPYFDVAEFKSSFKENFEGLVSLDHHYTRNKEEYLNGSVSEAISNGRLFTSKRSERIYSTDRARDNTLGVFESLEAEMTNISRITNISQWRETMVRRWMNTFSDLLPNKTGNDIADFYAAAGAKFTKGTQEALFAERTHAYIMRQIGLQTTEERTYQHLTRRMTEQWLKGGEVVESVGAKIRQGTGVLGHIRNINFNLTLGMFNPAQLLVQANGAATALILSPLHGLAAAKTFPLLRMALMSDKESVWRGLAKFDVGGNSDDFVSLVKAVRQTGILDNLRSTALYNLEGGGANIFASYPRKALGSHTFFFNRGEEFARVVSFDVARREWQGANAGMDWTSKEALKDIVVRMDDLTQNMTKANLARFQEGAASIPLQFAQYNIKLFMNVMSSLMGKGEGRGFTKTEAVKLMAGHVLLYGAAGNGLTWMVDEMLDNETKESMSVDQKTYLGQGLLSGLVSQVGEALTGERTSVALGSRLGAFDYYQKLASALFTDPKNVYEALMGPTVSTAKRLGVIGDVSYLWFKDDNLSGKDVLYGLAQMGSEQVTTLRNAAKAYLFHQHADKMLDKHGFPVAQLTPMEVMGQALGFQPTAAVDVFALINSKKAHDQAIGDIADTIYQVQKQIMSARLRGDHTYADEQHKLLVALWPVNAGDLMEVQRRIRDKLYPYDNKMQKLLADYLWKGHTHDQPMVITQPPRKQ